MDIKELFTMLNSGRHIDITENEQLKTVIANEPNCINPCQDDGSKKSLLINIIELLDSDANLNPVVRERFEQLKLILQCGLYDGHHDREQTSMSFSISLTKVLHSFMKSNYDSYLEKYKWEDYTIDQIAHDFNPKDMVLELFGIDIGNEDAGIVTTISASMDGEQRISITNVLYRVEDKYLSKFLLILSDLS